MYTIKSFFLKYMLITLLFVVTVLLAIQYYFSHTMVLELTQKRFSHLAKQTSIVIDERNRQAEDIVSILGHTPAIRQIDSNRTIQDLLRLFIDPIQKNNTIYAIYVGYPSGEYFEVVNINHSKAVAEMFKAPPGARWDIEHIVYREGKGYRSAQYYDADLKRISQVNEETEYDPRKRPWYRQALHQKGVVSTAPYLYFRLKKMGITYSMSVEGQAVIALDITLEGLNSLLKELKGSSDIEIYMVENGQLIASSEEHNRTVLSEDIATIFQTKPRHIVSYEKEGEAYLSMAIPAKVNGNARTWLVFRAKKIEMMKPYLNIIYSELAATLLLILLLVPMVRHLAARFVRPVSQLLQENEWVKNREFDRIQRVESGIVELNQLSDSLVDMAQSIQAYEKKQEELLDGLIRLVASTIDAKSPYTGEHCKKVPILAKMLIEEADKSQEGSLKNFSISSKEMMKGIEWSACLHDCGKLVIPDYVIDKATKLETVYNRIHEVRTRFEVLLRDAKITYLEALLRGDDPQKAAEELEAVQSRLQRDLTFIARINLGHEPMSDADYARLEKIAAIQWTRHFSKFLGISREERALLGEEGELPVAEHLILEGEEYKIERDARDFEFFKQEQVKMEIPPLLYNRGELYNLRIKQGTITKEERFKIQEHAIHTLKILKELPWTKSLKQVVEDAANHHEYIDGTGYPRALDKSQLSIPARVMAIADIFEALTASNRPYKKYKTLSQALAIMTEMVKANKLDAELYRVFIKSGIYLQYAEKYLKPKQIDLENIDAAAIIAEIKGVL